MNRFVAVAAAAVAALAASASAQTDCAGRWSNCGRCSAQCGTGTWTANYIITTQLTTGGKSCSAADGATRRSPGVKASENAAARSQLQVGLPFAYHVAGVAAAGHALQAHTPLYFF